MRAYFLISIDYEQGAIDEIRSELKESGLNFNEIIVISSRRACRNAYGKEMAEDDFDMLASDNDGAWFDDYDFTLEVEIDNGEKTDDELNEILSDKCSYYIGNILEESDLDE